MVWHDMASNRAREMSDRLLPQSEHDGIIVDSARVRPITMLALKTRVLGQGYLRRRRVPERAQGSLAAEIIENNVDVHSVLPLGPFHMV